MIRTSLIILIFLGGITNVFAQLKKGQLDLSKLPVPQSHFQPEYSFDLPSDPAGWVKQNPGIHAAFGSTDELYLRCEIPAVNQETKILEKTAWRGERVNAQILIWSADSVSQLRILAGDFVTSGGKSISAENIKLNMVRYVVSNFPYKAINFDCDSHGDSAWLLPDRFESFERFNLPGKTVRPVWISIDIPVNSVPGNYLGNIEIQSPETKIILQIKLKVQQQVLPKPHDWKFRLDLWQNPWVIAWYYNVKPWSAEHKILLKQHLKLYADAGGKYITCYTVHSPWSDNSYMIEGSMIEWIKTDKDSWKFDYSIFDQYIDLAIEAGIDKAITIYTPIPWGNRFRYLDSETGNYIYTEWSPLSSEYKEFWNLFLTDLKTHLVSKGWFGKTYLGINENEIELTLAAARMIKDHSKEWKITYAGGWHPELAKLLDDYCCIINKEPDPKDIKERADAGFTTTFYVCCNPPRPNNFVFSPPAEGRYLGWYAAAYGYNGFLRWAYDAWPADPARDARHTLWPAGDCFLVYPGGNSSIRFEKLREGISDYEKILILRDLTSKSDNPNVKKLQSALDKHLAGIATERVYSLRDYSEEKINADLAQGNKLIIELSEELGK